MFTGKFDFDVKCSTICNTVAPYISFAVLTDANDSAVFRVELPYRMVDGVAAIFTKSCDNFVL